MLIIDNEFLEFAKIELKKYIANTNVDRVDELADEILQAIDWNNSALMHKGFSWIVKHYSN